MAARLWNKVFTRSSLPKVGTTRSSWKVAESSQDSYFQRTFEIPQSPSFSDQRSDVGFDAQQRFSINFEVHLPFCDRMVACDVHIPPQALHYVHVREA